MRSAGEERKMGAYEHNVVIDLEFNPTPKETRKQGLKNEIIEIGAVKLDPAGKMIDVFSCTVKPSLNGAIAPKITRLTGIRTCDVSQSSELEGALRVLATWIGEERTRIVAWSKNDRIQIEAECAFKGIEVPSQLSRWLDLQVVYPRLMGIGNGRKMRLATAVDWFGIKIDSEEAHRALYDAKVTAELMRQLVTGEYRQQRKALDSAMPQSTGFGSALSAKLGAACSGLEDLKMQLLAKEQLAAA